MKRILFTGGGSAGHVVPNLAIMRELHYAYSLFYMGTGGIEQRLIANAGYPFFRVDCPKLVRAFTVQNLKIPFLLQRAKREALTVLQREKPDLVFSKGGFASYPAVWASAKLKIPVLTHESDLSPGLCTRLIAKKCAYVLTSFPETAKRFSNGKYVGSPVRREVLNGDSARARRKFGFPENDRVLLVFGGGSGSHALNQALESTLPELLKHFSVLHLTGLSTPLPQAILTDKYESNSSESFSQNKAQTQKHVYVCREFERDMGSAYAAAEVVLCRAGSNTVFELLALKKPGVLVPLSHSSRGDQLQNARYFAQKGLVKLLPEEQLDLMCDVICDAAGDCELKKNLDQEAIPNGTENIIKVIKEFLE